MYLNARLSVSRQEQTPPATQRFGSRGVNQKEVGAGGRGSVGGDGTSEVMTLRVDGVEHRVRVSLVSHRVHEHHIRLLDQLQKGLEPRPQHHVKGLVVHHDLVTHRHRAGLQTLRVHQRLVQVQDQVQLAVAQLVLRVSLHEGIHLRLELRLRLGRLRAEGDRQQPTQIAARRRGRRARGTQRHGLWWARGGDAAWFARLLFLELLV